MRRTAATSLSAVAGTGAPDAAAPGGHAQDGRPYGGAEPRRETMRTEFAFELPRGYVDEYGTVHRDGVMRLATARDELVPLRDDRVRENRAYLTVVLLGRVVTRIGTITDVHPGLIENFFASDLAFLQDLYRRVNSEGQSRAAVACPECRHEFTVDLSGSRLGES
ncbi:hypothetical protein [Planotetraspora kaengkrachanensis]|uniref:Secreted protein n=1 Tax=Planotetraspora kaengkrachanensis TaxID=575193 RepID=A0A8J3PWY7_9ACTN|nr:hypothetical protein [Planotetraspora kaengkrachanensis]GIG82681.1 hypothetical protein Pka01_58080 [Planotetraspora kaengkrachanensis]